MVDIISTHLEEIERKLRGHLPPAAIEVIIRMHDEQRMLQRSVNDLTDIVVKLKEAMVMGMQMQKTINGKLKKFEAKYGDNLSDLLTNEEAG